MDNYSKILNQIKSDLLKENVESNEDIISLYELYNILKWKLKEVSFITEEKNIFKRKNIFSRDLFKKVSYHIDDKNILIHIYPTNNENESFYIFKQYNNETLNFSLSSSKKYINKFMNKYYDELIYVFSILEEYSTLINYLTYKMDVNVFMGDYNLNIRAIHLGEIVINCKLITVETLNYFNKDSILELLDDSKYELAKKTSVNISKLDGIIKDIVKEYYNYENKSYKKC